MTETQELHMSGMALSGKLGQLWRDNRGLAVFMLLMFGFRSAWADWVVVPTGSMNPTIVEGDRLLVDKHVYGFRIPFTLLHLSAGTNPQRGEIVVFDSPRDGTSLVKRLIAVPGDTVEMHGEELMVNGIAATYQPGDERTIAVLLESTRRAHPIPLRESGLGVDHDILLLPAREQEQNLGPVSVPAGQYFVLGDNRDNSADSRYIGFVPRRNIVGRASRIVVSLDPEHYYRPRSGRLLKPLS
jgi:signal peptidase I